MSILEKSVVDLAHALDHLEAQLNGRLDDHSASDERIVAAQRQARAAREHAATASSGLAGAIDDLKALIEKTDAK